MMYKPFLKFFSLVFFLFIFYSCTPRIVSKEDILTNEENIIITKQENKENAAEESSSISMQESISVNNDIISLKTDYAILNEIEVILPKNKNNFITKNFLNSLELSLYKKNITNLTFNINTYEDQSDLNRIIGETILPGKIFIGPLTSADTKNINKWCSSNVVFLSFASDRQLASDCVYLINFFPEDELLTLFKHFRSDARIAVLYPDNQYGNYINKIIDNFAVNSNALIINKEPYNEDLSNARESIKKLSKYDLRRYELERQKKILQNRNDDVSKKALKKIERFETLGELDFTHIIIPDYNIRLLEIVPLLPFYDVDPQKIQFVGTGVWDDVAFFNEPSLQGAIFPGVHMEKRINYMNEYIYNYNEDPIRTITLIHDLVGLLKFAFENKLTIDSFFKLLNNSEISFEGIDGKFSFKNNLITRELEILRIFKGSANKIN